MPRSTPPFQQGPGDPGALTPAEDVFRILVVDREPQVAAVLTKATQSARVSVVQAPTLEDARRQLAAQRFDLALIEPALPDGSGLALAEQIGRSRRITQTIVISDRPSLEQAIDAIRAGAADFITKPLNLTDINQRIREAMVRQRRDRHRAQRVMRLRRICQKLDQARHDVSQQVDILCNDLVTAYQELAAQMQQVVQTQDFSATIHQELDLEKVLRKTLEYLLAKAGPTNAAIFLPASADEYSLGGYVNYDFTKESAEAMLQHLADVVAPKLAERNQPLHITDDNTLGQWIGDDAAYLADSHVLGFACRHDQEALAVIVLFRDQNQPFDLSAVDTCAAIGPLLGDYLAKVIRIHHRQLM